MWIAQKERQRIEFAFAEVFASGLMLSEVNVLPSFGQKGLGTALVKKVYNYAREAGFDTFI